MFSHQPSDSAEGFTALRRHDEYYLTGGDLFFLVEQNHFRVHRYFFERESQYFKVQLATPASPGSTRQGTSESTAIVLDNVKADNFARLLWVFYNPKYSLYKARVDDWVAIMELAHRWGFYEVMKLATREIERLEMPDIDRIVAYHKFEIDRSLLLYRYAALTARAEPLTLEEGTALGIETTLKIFRAREVARATPGPDGRRTPSPVTLPAEEMQSLILDVFEIPEDHQPSPSDEVLRAQAQASKQPETPTKASTVKSSPSTPAKEPPPPTPPAKTNGTSPTTATTPKKPAWGNASTGNKPANTTTKTASAWGKKPANAEGDKPADKNTTPPADNSPESAQDPDPTTGAPDSTNDAEAEKDAAVADKDAKASTGGLILPTLQVNLPNPIHSVAYSPSPLPIQLAATTRQPPVTEQQNLLAPLVLTKQSLLPPPPPPTPSISITLEAQLPPEAVKRKTSADDLDIDEGNDSDGDSVKTLEASSDGETRVDRNEHDDEFHDIHTTETDENYETWKNDAVNDDGAVEPLGDIRRDEASLVVDPTSTVSSGTRGINDVSSDIISQDTETALDAAHGDEDGLASSSTGVSVVAFPDSPETIICLPADTSIDPLTPVTEEEAPGATDDTDQKALEDSLEGLSVLPEGVEDVAVLTHSVSTEPAQSVNSSSEDFTIEVDMAEPSSSEPVSDDVTDAKAFEGGYHESFLPDDAESEITADLGLSPEAVLSNEADCDGSNLSQDDGQLQVADTEQLSETPATVWQAITDEPGQIANESFPSPSETETYNESKTTATAEEDPEPSSDLPSVSFGDDTSVPAATGSQTVDETWFDQSDTNPSYDSQPDSATPLEKETESADGADPWQLDATEENEAVAPAVDDPRFDQSDTNPSYDSRPDPVPPVENETESAPDGADPWQLDGTAEDEVAAPFTNDGDSNSANTPASQDVDQTLPESALTSDAPSNTDDGNSSPIEQDELHDAPGASFDITPPTFEEYTTVVISPEEPSSTEDFQDFQGHSMSFAEPPLPDALAQSEQASEIEAPGLDPETGELTPTETGLTSSAGSLEDQNTHAAGTEAPGLDSEAGESTLTEAGLTSPAGSLEDQNTHIFIDEPPVDNPAQSEQPSETDTSGLDSTIGESTWTETDLVASPANSLDDQNPQVPTNELLEAVENHEEVSEAEASSEAVENRKSNVDVDFSTTVADGKYDETGTEEGDATPLARTQSPGPDTELNSSAPATTLDPAPELNAPEFQIEFDSGDPPQLGEGEDKYTSSVDTNLLDPASGSTDPSFTQEDESTESSVKDPSSAETSLTSSDDPLLPKDYSHFLDAAQPLDTNTATLDAVNNLDLSAFDDSDAESNYFDSPEEPHDEGAFYAQ